MEEKLQACIFDIQSYSIHDGPGIRTTVFFKGCPLSCKWCHNPESNEHRPQLMYYAVKCVGCGQCVHTCPNSAISFNDGKVQTNRDLCINCGLCERACLYRARKLSGKMMNVDEVFEKVNSDKIFYEKSEGGITVSGGEPLASPRFVNQLLKKCKAEGIHTVIETCGYASIESIKLALEYADLVLFDIKAMDSELHLKLTGVKNEAILSNCDFIKNTLEKTMVIRIPIVPGYNDSNENMRSTAAFIKNRLGADVPVHLLAYHSLGDSKLDSLESRRERLEIDPPSQEHMEHIKSIFTHMGLKAQIGGSM